MTPLSFSASKPLIGAVAATIAFILLISLSLLSNCCNKAAFASLSCLTWSKFFSQLKSPGGPPPLFLLTLAVDPLLY